jgi:hypothetical protein
MLLVTPGPKVFPDMLITEFPAGMPEAVFCKLIPIALSPALLMKLLNILITLSEFPLKSMVMPLSPILLAGPPRLKTLLFSTVALKIVLAPILKSFEFS